ncbi:PAS domain-containing hybrid sensor histidine kinase/response regulator [Chitinivibrio alkaliphilus]|uniref:histidine kinase n=1 Tax=Chitinivibrio alkaliphilus ACht1 TaxID=1313304 RepID=U7D4K4_9BACT|nr:PAS domain-containing hybrid sensor histidine kinase/response regulator [Chitinivibrio alkaliphilus]ERP30863.1 pas/pac sensor signal transduction histidine kinase [Chitinivibrio alkaliphilus ACht1]
MKVDRKFWTAIIFGFVGLWVSGLRFDVIMENTRITLHWGFALPLLVALLYGARYGLLSGLLGLGGFFPFLLWPGNGYANIASVVLYILLYVYMGYFAEMRRRNPGWWNHILLVSLLYALCWGLCIYFTYPPLLALNPPIWYPDASTSISQGALKAISTKGPINIFAIIMAVVALHKTNMVRRVFGLPPISWAHRKGKTLALCFGAGTLFWCIYVLCISIFVTGTFPFIANTLYSPDSVVAALVFFVVSSISAVILMEYNERQVKLHELNTATVQELKQAHLVVENSKVISVTWRNEEGWPVSMVSGNIIQFGYSPDDFLSGRVQHASIVHPDDLEQMNREIENYTSRNIDTYHQEYRIIGKDGSIHWIEDRTTVIRGSDGTIMEFQGILLDITERKQAEFALINSEKRFRSIISVSNTGAWEYHRDSNYLWCSPEYFTMLGYDPEEFSMDGSENIKEVWVELLHPDDRDRASGHFADYLSGGSQGMYENYFRMIHKDGSDVWIWSRGQTLRNDDGTPSDLTVGTHIDMTQKHRDDEKQAKLTEELHQSQKMDAVGQLAGGVAHDFNNALGGILGAAELLKSGKNSPEKHDELIDMIITAADRAGRLTKKLLTFSRTGAKVSSAVNCAHIVEETVELLRHTIDKSITVSVENSALQTSVIGDDALLQNVFVNLGINASHAMPEGGTLTFTLENLILDEEYCEVSPFDITPGEYLDISVSDTGCGMSSEVQARIFEPFFTTKDSGKGTGLGLSAVFGTVQEHQGVVTVYSEVGTGTVFHIYLPVTGETVRRTIEQKDLTDASGQTVLVVDDEELIRVVATSHLRSIGYGVICATNGEEAVQTFREAQHEIDVVILDMIMPTMGGREAFYKLRKIRPDIPIIISSGFAKNEDMAELKKQGVSGFLSKPFRKEELVEILVSIRGSRP